MKLSKLHMLLAERQNQTICKPLEIKQLFQDHVTCRKILASEVVLNVTG